MADERRSAQRATALFGLLLLVGAVVMIVDGGRLPDGGPGLGPGVAPIAIGALLGVVGAGLLVQARGALRIGAQGQTDAGSPTGAQGEGDAALPAAPPDHGQGGGWWRVGALVAALLAFALLLPVIGYVVTSAGLFTAAALLLGAPRRWTVPAYGWAVAAIAFLVFDRLIGLSLPVGPWGF